MRHLFKVSVIAAILIFTLSCSKQDADSGGGWAYKGAWKQVGIMGTTSLDKIKGIYIGDETVTMYFQDGSSNTVRYVYKENDTTFDGSVWNGLIFDKPLYTYHFVDDYPISHVVLGRPSVREFGLVWEDYELSHVILFNRE